MYNCSAGDAMSKLMALAAFEWPPKIGDKFDYAGLMHKVVAVNASMVAVIVIEV